MEHRYQVDTTWTGNLGEGTSGYKTYSRDVTLTAAGKPELLGSADRPFRGDPQRWNPEELLLGALAQCHLLSYLHACVTAGVQVLEYTDHATGTMVTEGNGGRFTRVVLHPVVTVAAADQVEAALAAHPIAHQWCFIANSVNFEVLIEPTVSAGTAPR